jgi:hypothetical protein
MQAATTGTGRNSVARSGGFNRRAMQWAIVVALGFVAVAYFIMPSRAQEKPDWSAELWSTEGGEQLVAVAYVREPQGEELVPALTVVCGSPLWLRYDPGPGEGETIDWSGQTATFEFTVGDKHIERELQFEEMDANWSTELTSGDELLAAIEAGSEVTVLMPNGGLPEHTFSLRGSSAAIRDVRNACR